MDLPVHEVGHHPHKTPCDSGHHVKDRLSALGHIDRPRISLLHSDASGVRRFNPSVRSSRRVTDRSRKNALLPAVSRLPEDWDASEEN